MLKLTALATLVPSLVFAVNITNDIAGVGPNGSIKPYICIQDDKGAFKFAIEPGTTKDAGKEGYVGATIRFEGCSPSNTYLGYIGFLMKENGNNSIDSYSPPEGVHIAFNNRAIDSAGHV
ncbi:MAG: hypothetical protein H0U73_10130, partial [Tatlockia sp.]|nr:hypothetical protein [Tatlockia sp.]